MILDLARALLGALVAVVLPGYFWAAFLRPAGDLAQRLTYSMVASMASVPVIALVLARIAGTGVTLWVAIGAVAIVFGSGLAAYVVKGPAAGSADPVLPRPQAIRDARTLALIAAAFVLVLASMARSPAPGPLLILIAALLLAAGALAARPAPAGRPAASGRAPAQREPAAALAIATATSTAATATPTATAAATEATAAQATPAMPATRQPAIRAAALAVILTLTTLRAYAAAIRYDWPNLRGSDLFSHAVMAEQMMSHGSYGTYLIYPPGFSTLTAVICRLSGLTPLALFPVLAPALLLVTTMGAYALASRLWGWEFGLAAAALSGLVLAGAYAGFAEGRYPDLTSAYFLIVMTVAALVTLYESPSPRSAVLVAVIGASVVLYHSVATLYLALLLALVAVTGLPYLLLRQRAREARTLFLALAGLAILALCYAWETYQLGQAITGKSGTSSATSTAVSIAVGTQAALPPVHLLTQLSPALVWVGALGAAVLAMGIRYLRTPAQVLTAVTMLLWCGLMYLGSRTAVDGFPQRFERDIGAPLSVIGALGAGLVAVSLRHWLRRPKLAAAGTAALAAAGALVLVLAGQAVQDLRADVVPARDVLSVHVAAAGRWLAAHNSGGTIITTPYMNHGITNRAVLAMGDYTGLQSYGAFRVKHPRSLPPAGRQPLLDSQAVLLHPATCQAAGILIRDDVRYVVLYKVGNGADVPAFAADPALYRRVFENKSVIIYAATHAPCPG